jgi:ArsR family transcriptional regulator
MHEYESMNMKMTDAAELFKALGEPIRLRLAHLLVAAKGQELCNCEFVDALEEPQSNISRHLKILAQAGLVHERRDGRWIYYGLAADEPAVAALAPVIASFKDSALQDDWRRLRERLAIRQAGKCVLGVQKTHLLSGSAS